MISSTFDAEEPLTKSKYQGKNSSLSEDFFGLCSGLGTPPIML